MRDPIWDNSSRCAGHWDILDVECSMVVGCFGPFTLPVLFSRAVVDLAVQVDEFSSQRRVVDLTDTIKVVDFTLPLETFCEAG